MRIFKKHCGEQIKNGVVHVSEQHRFFILFIRSAQNIVGCYTVIVGKFNQMTYRQVICSTLVSCVHRL